MKLPCAIRNGGLVEEEEERVDEIECKVFIKCSDSEPAIRSAGSGCSGTAPVLPGYTTSEKTVEFALKLVESRTCSGVGQTFKRLCGGRERERERERAGNREKGSNQSSL